MKVNDTQGGQVMGGKPTVEEAVKMIERLLDPLMSGYDRECAEELLARFYAPTNPKEAK